MRCIVGPTASGKGAFALRVARRIGAQIVSMDSMKVYRGMNVGTAKPDAHARREVRFHLIDVVETDQPYSVSDWLRDAREACRRIAADGDVPLFVGGTALYLQALLYGLFAGPPADPALRRRLAEQASREGPEPLHAQLEKIDPDGARRIHPHDLRRIVRALEVHHVTGRPISQVQTQWGGAPAHRLLGVGIRWPRQLLVRRIDRRVERMFAFGLPDEVQRIGGGRGFGREASQAVGYKELLQETSLDAAREAIRRRTRQLAKRQMTWFRKFSRIHWIDVRSEADLERAVEPAVRILAMAER